MNCESLDRELPQPQCKTGLKLVKSNIYESN